MMGAPHGAATSPDTAPMTNAPENRPAVPACDARSIMDRGIGTGTTSNIMSAATMSRFAMAKYSHGLVLTDPNSVPVIPAITPSTEYSAARPRTYVRVSNTGRQRLGAPGAPLTD